MRTLKKFFATLYRRIIGLHSRKERRSSVLATESRQLRYARFLRFFALASLFGVMVAIIGFFVAFQGNYKNLRIRNYCLYLISF